jgi:hypothetical protein
MRLKNKKKQEGEKTNKYRRKRKIKQNISEKEK